MVDIRKLANTLLKILNDMPRDDSKINNVDLLNLAKERTGDNTLTPYDLNDAVNFLKSRRAVIIYTPTLGMVPYDFHSVEISFLGRNGLQADNDLFLDEEKKSQSQEIHIGKVEGDVQISQNGNNIMVKSEQELEITFQDLKDKIRSNPMLSEAGKEDVIENVEILEDEENKVTPDKGRAQRAYNWIKMNAPPFVKDIVINLIANLIAQGIVT